jgi:hypothetical protein
MRVRRTLLRTPHTHIFLQGSSELIKRGSPYSTHINSPQGNDWLNTLDIPVNHKDVTPQSNHQLRGTSWPNTESEGNEWRRRNDGAIGTLEGDIVWTRRGVSETQNTSRWGRRGVAEAQNTSRWGRRSVG